LNDNRREIGMKVNTAELKAAINAAKKGVGKFSPYIRLAASENELIVVGASNEITVKIRVAGKGNDTFDAFVGAYTLEGILSNLPASEEETSLAESPLYIQICAGKSRMKIPKAQAVNFERKIDEDIEKKEVESLDFIQNVCHATSTQTRAVHPLFKAVFIEMGKNSMKASATDSYRASIRGIGESDMQGIIVSSCEARNACRIIRGAARIGFPESGKYLVLENDSVQIILGAIDGHYYDLEALMLNRPDSVSTSVDRQELVETLQMCSVISNYTEMHLAKEGLEVNAEGETGAAFQTMEAKNVKGVAIGESYYATEYLLEAVKSIQDERVNLHFGSYCKPLIVTGNEDEKEVILPVRK
jgi:DNA polymerase III sliding clamp (beta) subunit (PCNA family)